MTADRSSAFTAASVPDSYELHLAPVVFEPWARILADTAGVAPGDEVLDVASGTGAVARLVAGRAGASGRVVASDISAAMLAHARTCPVPAGAAAIEYVEASAVELPFADASFDVVVCQQGLQFIPDRAAAVREMRRVLRDGGVAGAAVWAAGHRLEPFDEYNEALVAIGAEPPFPGAFENASFVMSADEASGLFEAAGFAPIEVSLVEHVVTWPDPQVAVDGIFGTPFGPLVQGLDPARRTALDADLARRFAPDGPDGPLARTTAAVVVRATA